MPNNVYTSYSGSQIIAVTDEEVFDTMQAVSCSVTAEKAPIYVMGKREYHGVTTNKLAAAGSIVAIIDQGDPFGYKLKGKQSAEADKIYLPKTDVSGIKVENVQNSGGQTDSVTGVTSDTVRQKVYPRYAFELKPFNLVLVGVDLEGNAIKKVIEQCSIINEGFVTGIDEDHLQMTYAFIAKRTEPWQKVKG